MNRCARPDAQASAPAAVGSGLGGTVGAATAFNADANNRMMHMRRFKTLVETCRSSTGTTSIDCAGIVKMAGIQTDAEGSRIEGLPGLLLTKNRDASGAVVGALLIDAASGDQRYAMDLADLQKLESMDMGSRLEYVKSSEVETVLGKSFCNPISLLCIAPTEGMPRHELEGLHAFIGGKHAVIYSGSAVKLDQFIFTKDYPAIGQSAKMVVNWPKMSERYGDITLLLGDHIGHQNDATKFGSIRVTRTSATTVQIHPNDFDFDLNGSIRDTLASGLRNREMLTLIGGLLAGGFSTHNRTVSHGPGRPVSVIFDGETKLPSSP